MSKISIPYKHAEELLQALVAIDEGSPVVIDGESGRKTVVKVPFALGGICRMTLVRNLGAARNAVEQFVAVRNGLIREISGGQDQIKPEARDEVAKFASEMDKLLASPCEGEFRPFTQDDLKLDQNAIPARALEVLVATGLLAI